MVAWPVTVLLMLGGATLVVLVPLWYRRARRARAWRLEQFARANHLHYVPELGAPALPGMIFAQGHSKRARDLVRGTEPRFVEFANYRYTTGSGKNQSTHTWGYVAIKLDVPLPHIVLDAKGNNSLFGTNLPVSLDPQQRLRLEGEFNDFFTLYCPQGYETDALYLFTPDIMARFIDHAAALDIEIVGHHHFIGPRLRCEIGDCRSGIGCVYLVDREIVGDAIDGVLETLGAGEAFDAADIGNVLFVIPFVVVGLVAAFGGICEDEHLVFRHSDSPVRVFDAPVSDAEAAL